MFRQSAFFLALALCLSALCRSAAAHKGHSHETDALAERVFAKTLQLGPEIFSPPREGAVSYPYIKVRGRPFYFNRVPPSPDGKSAEAPVSLNSQFWTLVEYWLQLYHNELSVYCPCEWDPGQLAAEARETVYQGFFSAKISQPVTNKLADIVEAGYDLGGRYGKAVLALQIAAEAAETVLFKGNHLLCKLNNVLVFVIVRRAQMLARLTGHAARLDESRWIAMARYGWAARAVRKAQKKVHFHLRSALLNEEALRQANHEGYKNKRESWLRTVSQKAAPLIERGEELDERIAELEVAAEAAFSAAADGAPAAGRKERRAARKAEKAARKLTKTREGLDDKIGSITELSRKTYLGRRIGLSLWLLPRRWSARYLHGSSPADRAAEAGGWLYALAASENIMERAFAQRAAAFFEKNSGFLAPPPAPEQETSLKRFEAFFKTPSRAHRQEQEQEQGDESGMAVSSGASLGNEAEIRRGLAQEFAAELKKAGLTSDEEGAAYAAGQLLSDAARIFDPSKPLFERYALHSIMEAAIAGFFPYYTDIVYRRIKRLYFQTGEPLPLSAQWRQFRLRLSIRAALSDFVYHAYQHFDFLRAAAVTKNETALASVKYESMEGLLRFLRYLADLGVLIEESAASVPAGGTAALADDEGRGESLLLRRLRASGAKIAALQPWRERRTAFGLADLAVPFFNPPLPRCRDLALKRPVYSY